MTPYYIWINRHQLPVQITQEDISFSFRQWIIFKIRQTSGPESDQEDDSHNDDVMQSDERLPDIRLDFRFLQWNNAIRLSCDKEHNVWWQDVDSNTLEKPLWSEGQNRLQLEWDKEYQFHVLEGQEYVSMLLMVTKDTGYPIRSPSPPSRPSTPVTSFAVGRDTPSPDRTPKRPGLLTALLRQLQTLY